MEENKLSFIIEGRNLYLDAVLIGMDQIPLFFICKDESDYYAALCYDIEQWEYYIVKCNKRDIVRMLYGKIPMRDLFLINDTLWHVCASNEIEDDMVSVLSRDEMDRSVLPVERGLYEIVDDVVKKYARSLEKSLSDQYVSAMTDLMGFFGNNNYTIFMKYLSGKYVDESVHYVKSDLNHSAERKISFSMNYDGKYSIMADGSKAA